MFNLFGNYLRQKAFCVALAVFVATMVGYYFAFSGIGWMVFAAFVVCQTTRGTPLKQGFNYVFVVALIAIVLPPHSMQVVKLRLLDVLMGGVIGLVFSQLLLSMRLYTEFSRGVVPIFNALLRDFQIVEKYFANKIHDPASMRAHIFTIERVLGARESMYPEWVYEIGFNPGLRAGFRFFLLHTEQLAEIVFSLNYLSVRALKSELIEGLRVDILQVMHKNEELLQALLDYFTKKTNKASEADYTSDMQKLEETLSQYVPSNIELLDIEPDYMVLTGLVRDLKDARKIMLQLLVALPG